MRTAVVILNWNTKDYLRRFLPGLIQSLEGLDAEAIVADSASADGSMEMMAEEFPGIRRIPLDRNYGFTGGYNRALSQVNAEYYVLLNSDIEVTKNWLKPLVDWMDGHKECGICGSKLLSFQDRGSFEYAGAAGGYLDAYGYPFCRGRVLKILDRDRGQYDTPARVMWVSGACLMIRSSLWKSLGGLDDRFFAHMEEIDLCWRAQLHGQQVWVVPESKVYHLGGGTLPASSPWKLELNYRNNLLLLENNAAMTYASRGSAPAKALRKASCLIFRRKILDGLAGLAYLLMLKPSSTAAVVKAHREYRGLRRAPDLKEIGRCYSERPEVCGLSRVHILAASACRGNKIFDWLSKSNAYENRH
jgi:GT2 family glycosyltransferase